MNKKAELKSQKRFNHFWLIAGLLSVILIAPGFYYGINRPVSGLHSWAAASGRWAARSHVKYGLKYTRGLSTWAVGDPPVGEPKHYLDHPQLNVLLAAGAMKIFGINEWSLRVVGMAIAIATFIVFLKILRGLLDDKTVLLAGFFLAIFPITAYFHLGGWAVLAGTIALWCYLRIIGALRGYSDSNWIHKFALALSLFMTLQFGWGGFFYAFPIGIHYVCRCLFGKRRPEWSLLAILVLAQAASLLVNFTIMAAGYNWDFNKIYELYKWRAAKGEMRQMSGFDWGAWLAKFGEFAKTNFSMPILVTTVLYLTFGQLIVFSAKESPKIPSRRFPQFWLFLMIPLSQLLLLRGCLWRHQSWERPVAPFLAIAVALAVMLVADLLKKIHKWFSVAVVAILVVFLLAFCLLGTEYYYSVRWQPQQKIDMFKKLNKQIPPDKALLSFKDFIVNQHKSKGGFYRPEVAWYLDREIVQAGVVKNRQVMVAESIRDIETKAATGRFPYYLIPAVNPLKPVISILAQKYKYDVIKGVQYEKSKDGKFLKAGMTSYLIFDLNSKVR